MNTLVLKSGKYNYIITYKKKHGLPFIVTNRNTFFPKIRTTQRLYFDHHDNIVKEIVYPRDLWYTHVLENDPVEEYIGSIMNFVPNWEKIEIENDKIENENDKIEIENENDI